LTFDGVKVVRIGEKLYHPSQVPAEFAKLLPAAILAQPAPPMASYRPYIRGSIGVPIDLYKQDLTGTLYSGEVIKSDLPPQETKEKAQPTMDVTKLAALFMKYPLSAFFFVGQRSDSQVVALALLNSVSQKSSMIYNPLKGLCLSSMSDELFDANVVAAIHTDILAFVLDSDHGSSVPLANASIPSAPAL